MGSSGIPPDSTFTSQARNLGIVAAWTAFAVTEVYAVVSGLAYASQGAAVESGPYLSIMALLVVVMGPFLMLPMVAVHAYAAPRHKPYGLAALAFMIACIAVTSCINFFLLLVSSQPGLFSESVRALFLPAGGRSPRSSWTTSSGIGSSGYRCCWRLRSFAETLSGTRFAS